MPPDLLHRLMPHASRSDVEAYARPLGVVALRYDITTPDRLAHWLAQLAHESGSLRYREEIASGAAYEGRRDLGNIQPGDGKRFKGRGLIQLTGRANYRGFQRHLEMEWGDPDVDVIRTPDVVADPWYGSIAAGYFWQRENLNALADRVVTHGDAAILRLITKKVNGGDNGLKERQDRLTEARRGLRGLELFRGPALRRMIEVYVSPEEIEPRPVQDLRNGHHPKPPDSL